MNREWVVDLVERIPQGMVSRAWGWVARRQRPRLGVAILKRVFVKATGINMREAKEPITSFDTLEDLFVRELRSGARRIEPDPSVFVSPVDARIGACGRVEEGTLIQAKGRNYSLARLLGNEQDASRFEGGDYATLYLSPCDYHRIHSPVAGQVADATLIPGRLMPVFREAIDRVDELFARNERLITYIDSPDAGRVGVVKVGATLVGRISVVYDDDLHSNIPGQLKRQLTYNPPRLLQKGGMLGAFELGSTVVLLTEPGRVALDHLEEGGAVKMGSRLGTVVVRGRTSKKKSSGGSDRGKKRRASRSRGDG